jgi:hypothetical protein
MADAEVLALLDHIKDVGERTEKKLDAHIERDENVNRNFVLPLWNHHQKQLGAEEAEGKLARQTATRGAVAGYCINVIISIAAAWAAIKALK